jgi:hypothetical protein
MSIENCFGHIIHSIGIRQSSGILCSIKWSFYAMTIGEQDLDGAYNIPV